MPTSEDNYLCLPMSLKISFNEKTKFMQVKGALSLSGIISYKAILSATNLVVTYPLDDIESRPPQVFTNDFFPTKEFAACAFRDIFKGEN